MKKKHITKRILSLILAILILLTTIPAGCISAFADTLSGQPTVSAKGERFPLKVSWIGGATGGWIMEYSKVHARHKTYNDPTSTDLEIKCIVPDGTQDDTDIMWSTQAIPIYRIARSGGYSTSNAYATSDGLVAWQKSDGTLDFKTFYRQINKVMGADTLNDDKARYIYYVLQNSLKQFTKNGCADERLYFLATQAIIWEIAEGKRIDWGNDTTTFSMDKSTGEYDVSVQDIARPGLSSSYCNNGVAVWTRNENPYPCYWHDWYYNIKNNYFPNQPDYYAQILAAAERQEKSGDDWASYLHYGYKNSAGEDVYCNSQTFKGTEGIARNLTYNSERNRYELCVDLGSDFAKVLGNGTGNFDYNKIVLPIRCFETETYDNGNKLMLYGNSTSNKSEPYTVEVDYTDDGDEKEYYHLFVKEFPYDEGSSATIKITGGPDGLINDSSDSILEDNAVTILGITADNSYYYVKYTTTDNIKDKKGNITLSKGEHYGYIKKGSKKTQDSHVDNASSDALRLSEYEDGTVCYPKSFMDYTFNCGEFSVQNGQNKENGRFLLYSYQALDTDTNDDIRLYWSCNGVSDGVYNTPIVFTGSTMTQGFACGGNGIKGTMSIRLGANSNNLQIKAVIDSEDNNGHTTSTVLPDVVWQKNIHNPLSITNDKIVHSGPYYFYGDESTTGDDDSNNTYLYNYIQKQNTKDGIQYDVSKWTVGSKDGEEIDFNNGIKITSNQTLFVHLKEKKKNLTDRFVCLLDTSDSGDKGKTIYSVKGYTGLNYTVPDGNDHVEGCNKEGLTDEQKNSLHFAYWDTNDETWEAATNPPKNAIFANSINTFGKTGKTYYAKYTLASSRIVRYVCCIDDKLVKMESGEPGDSYKAPNGADHINQDNKDKCLIPETITIDGVTYNKNDVKFTFAYWDKDGSTILAKTTVPDDAVLANSDMTIPKDNTTYYAKYYVEAKKTVEFKCSLCGEVISTATNWGGEEVTIPYEAISKHICSGSAVIGTNYVNLEDLNKEFKCWNKNSSYFDFSNALNESETKVTIPKGVLTEENKITTYYAHYNIKDNVKTVSHLLNLDYYQDKVNSAKSTEMASDTAASLQAGIEKYADVDANAEDEGTQKAREILNKWQNDFIKNKKWNAAITWKDNSALPGFDYSTINENSDMYSCEFITNENSYTNTIAVTNNSADFEIKYIVVTDKNGNQTSYYKNEENKGIYFKIETTASAASNVNVDVYFDVPKTDFTVTINYVLLMDENGDTIDISNTDEVPANAITVDSIETTKKVVDGFNFGSGYDDNDGVHHDYFKPNVDYDTINGQYSGYYGVSKNGTYTKYNEEYNTNSTPTFAEAGLDKTIYAEDDFSVYLYYTPQNINDGYITFTLELDPNDVNRPDSETDAALSNINVVLYRSKTINPGVVDYDEFMKLYNDPKSDIEWVGPGGIGALSDSINNTEITSNTCGSTAIKDGCKYSKTTFYYCSECDLYYDSKDVGTLFGNKYHRGTGYKLNNGSFEYRTSSFNKCKNPTAIAKTGYKVVTADSTYYRDSFDSSMEAGWTCQNGHKNSSTVYTCTKSFGKSKTYKKSLYSYDKGYYYFFVINPYNHSDVTYTPEVTNSSYKYYGQNVNYKSVVSLGSTKSNLRVGVYNGKSFTPAVGAKLLLSEQPFDLENDIYYCPHCLENDTKSEIKLKSGETVCNNCGYKISFENDKKEIVTTDGNGEIRFGSGKVQVGDDYYVIPIDDECSINGKSDNLRNYYGYYNTFFNNKSAYIDFNADKAYEYTTSKATTNGPVYTTTNNQLSGNCNIKVAHNASQLMFYGGQDGAINVHFNFDPVLEPYDNYANTEQQIFIGTKIYKINDDNSEEFVSDYIVNGYDSKFIDFSYAPLEEGKYKFVPCFYYSAHVNNTAGDYELYSSFNMIKYYDSIGEIRYCTPEQIKLNGLSDDYKLLSFKQTDSNFKKFIETDAVVNYKNNKNYDVYFKCVENNTSYNIVNKFYSVSNSYASSIGESLSTYLENANFKVSVYKKNNANYNLCDEFDINDIKSNLGGTDKLNSYYNPDEQYNIFSSKIRSLHPVSFVSPNNYTYILYFYSNYPQNIKDAYLRLSIVNTSGDENGDFYVTIKPQNPEYSLRDNYENLLSMSKSYDTSESTSSIPTYDDLTNYPVVWDYKNNIDNYVQAKSSSEGLNKITTEIRIDQYAKLLGWVISEDDETLVPNQNFFNKLDFAASETKDVVVGNVITDTALDGLVNAIKNNKQDAICFDYYTCGKYDYKNVRLTKPSASTSNPLPYKEFMSLGITTHVDNGIIYNEDETFKGYKCIKVDHESPTLKEDVKEILNNVTAKFDNDTANYVVIRLLKHNYLNVTQNIRLQFLAKNSNLYNENQLSLFMDNPDVNLGIYYNKNNTRFTNLQTLYSSMTDEENSYFKSYGFNNFKSFSHLNSNYYDNQNNKFGIIRKGITPDQDEYPDGTLYKDVNQYIDSENKVYVKSIDGKFSNGTGAAQCLILNYKIDLDKSDIQSPSAFTGTGYLPESETFEFDDDGYPILQPGDRYLLAMTALSTRNTNFDNFNKGYDSYNSGYNLTNILRNKRVKVEVVLDGLGYTEDEIKSFNVNGINGTSPTIKTDELGRTVLTYQVPVQTYKNFYKANEYFPSFFHLDAAESDNIIISDENGKTYDVDELNNGVFLEKQYENNNFAGYYLSAKYIYKDTTIYLSKNNKFSINTSISNGTITDSVSDIPAGENRTISFKPNDGCYINSVTVDGKVLDSDEIEMLKVGDHYEYVFENIQANHTIDVVCSKHYSVTTSITNGIITDSIYNIIEGDSKTISFTPNTDYGVYTIEIDGTVYSKTDFDKYYTNGHYEYTFNNINANHTVKVICRTCEVSAFAENGTITPNGTFNKSIYTDFTVNFEPNDGYYLESVKVQYNNNPSKVEYYTEETLSDLNSLTLNTSEYSSISIIVKYSRLNVTTNITNGTITPSKGYKWGSTANVTFTPNDGYYISEVIIDKNKDSQEIITVSNAYAAEHNNQITYKNGSWIFENLQDSHSIEVHCVLKPTITFISYVTDRVGNETVSTGMFKKYRASSNDDYITQDETNPDSLVLSVYPEDDPALYYNGENSGYYITKIENWKTDGSYTTTAQETLDKENATYNHPNYLGNGYRYLVEKINRKIIIHWNKIYVDVEAKNASVQSSPDGTNKTTVIPEDTYDEWHSGYATTTRKKNIHIYGTPYAYTSWGTVTATRVGKENTFDWSTLADPTITRGVNWGSMEGIESNPDYFYNIKFTTKFNNLSVSIDNNGCVEYQELSSYGKPKSTSANGVNTDWVKGIKYNTAPVLNIKPAEGYQVKSISINGSLVSDILKYKNGGLYTIPNITKDTQVDIKTIAVPAYDVETYISNGTISESVYNIDASEKPSTTITFKPNDGYKVKSVLVNGETIKNVENYIMGGDYTINYDFNSSEIYQKYKVQVICEKSEFSSLIVYLNKNAVNTNDLSSPLSTDNWFTFHFTMDKTTRDLTMPADELKSKGYVKSTMVSLGKAAGIKVNGKTLTSRLHSTTSFWDYDNEASEILENKNTTGYYNSKDFPYYRVFTVPETVDGSYKTYCTIESASYNVGNRFQKYDYCFEQRKISDGNVGADNDHTKGAVYDKVITANDTQPTFVAGCYYNGPALNKDVSVEFIQPNEEYHLNTNVFSTFKIINNTDDDLTDVDAYISFKGVGQGWDENDQPIAELQKISNFDYIVSVSEGSLSTVTWTQTANYTEKVVVPAHSSNIFYVKWTVPRSFYYDKIIPSAEVVDASHGIYSKTDDQKLLDEGKWVNITKYSDKQIESEGYNINGGNGFTYSDSKNDKEYYNTVSWEEWSYDDKNGFVKHKYNAKLSFDNIALRPYEKNNPYVTGAKNWRKYANPSQLYDDTTGTWTTKSGYGVQLNAAANELSVVDENGNESAVVKTALNSKVAAYYRGYAQTAQVFYPEYNFVDNSDFSELLYSGRDMNDSDDRFDFVLQSRNDTNYMAGKRYTNGTIYRFPTVGDSSGDKNDIHMIPIWYPDNTEYKVQIKLSDAWTPAGALSYLGDSNPVTVKGSLFEDYKSRETAGY